MSAQYISSMVTKYGDASRVKQDSKTVFDILNRQGPTFIIDVLAEYIGEIANRFKFNSGERAVTIRSRVGELEAALKERV